MNKNNQPEYKAADQIVDAVMEWIGQKWTPSMIRRELREAFPDITFKTCNWFIRQARIRIRERYKISPEEYKGEQISFYESIIRNQSKVIDKLKAAERLDKLLGLESISNVDPAALVTKILEFKRMAMQSVGGHDNGGSENGGNREAESNQEALNGEDAGVDREAGSSNSANGSNNGTSEKSGVNGKEGAESKQKAQPNEFNDDEVATALEVLEELHIEKEL